MFYPIFIPPDQFQLPPPFPWGANFPSNYQNISIQFARNIQKHLYKSLHPISIPCTELTEWVLQVLHVTSHDCLLLRPVLSYKKIVCFIKAVCSLILAKLIKMWAKLISKQASLNVVQEIQIQGVMLMVPTFLVLHAHFSR